MPASRTPTARPRPAPHSPNSGNWKSDDLENVQDESSPILKTAWAVPHVAIAFILRETLPTLVGSVEVFRQGTGNAAMWHCRTYDISAAPLIVPRDTQKASLSES